MTEHPLSRCPIDGARLSRIDSGLSKPTVYTHRDGRWHLDPVTELAESARFDLAWWLNRETQ